MPMQRLDGEKTCVVVFDIADVNGLEDVIADEAIHDQLVLPLTPNAHHVATLKGYKILPPTDVFGDEQQHRLVLRLNDIRNKTDQALKKLPAPEREILRSEFDRMIFSQLRIEETLRHFSSCTIRVQGRWQSLSTPEAITSLQRELIARRMASRGGVSDRIQQAPFCQLHELLTRWLTYAVRLGEPRGRVILGAMKDVSGVVDGIVEQGGRVIVITGAQGSWRDYGSLLKQVLNLFRHDSPVVLRVSGDMNCEMDGVHLEIANTTKEPAMQLAADCADQTFRRSLVGFARARKQIGRLLKLLKPTAYLSSEISHEIELLVSESAGHYHVPRIVLGRNAQGPTDDANAIAVKRLYLTTRYPAGLVDVALFWSDWGVAVGHQYLGRGVRIGRVSEPKSYSSITNARNRKGDGVRRIVLADSFGAWWTRHWWALQTADEYCEGVRVLADAVKDLNGVELIVRAKEKPELSMTTLREMFSDCPNVIIEGRGRSFAEALAEADLVVSFFSTTIQEALQAGCPVLLFGGTKRHYYLPPRFKAPSCDDRGSVYGYDGTIDLAAFLIAILDSHAGRPLTQDERAGFAADSRAPTPADIGAALAAGEMPRLFDPQAMHA